MLSPISSITRAATRKETEPLRILTAPTHESYETNLCRTGHEFYAIRVLDGSIKDWDSRYRQTPENYHLLNPKLGQDQVPVELDFDLVLSQNRFGQYQLLSQFANVMHLPLLCIEHTLPVPSWSEAKRQSLRQMSGNINVFISDFSRKEWGWDDSAEIIHHGVDTTLFSANELLVQKKPHALSVVNDWIKRNWCCGYDLWKEATEGLPTVVLGATPGLSEPAKSVHDLVRHYRQAQLFVNTSLVSPIPSVVLEAMACGLPVVSTDTAMLPEVITDGVDGFLCKDARSIKWRTKQLLADPALCKTMGAAARQTILKKFSLDKFVENWDRVLRKTADIVFK